MADYFNDLLTLCGFEDDEIRDEQDRIRRAFEKLELSEDDIRSAITWLKKYQDIELLGVRKVLRLWLKELIDLIFAREDGKKLVYYGYPTISGLGITLAVADRNLIATCPDVVLCSTMGQIFNKLTPILEAGEANGLPPGHSLCSLQQIRVGGMAKGIVPVADMVLTSSYYCDMGSKTDELIHERYGHPAIYCDGCIDSKWAEFPEYLPERTDFLGYELEKALVAAREIIGVDVTDDDRREALKITDGIFGALTTLNDLVDQADPQPISSSTIQLTNALLSGSTSQRIINEGPAAINILIDEVKQRMSQGIGVVEKGAPRVAALMAHLSDPRIDQMMEGCGLAMPLSILLVAQKKSGITIPTITGPYLAQREMIRGVYHSSYGFIQQAVIAAREPHIEGIIWNYMFNCRPVAEVSHLLKQVVEEETGKPVLMLEMDVYDSRDYSPGALQTRVETFADMLRAKRSKAGHSQAVH